MKSELLGRKVKSTDYAYSLGRVSALEKYLLPSRYFREAAALPTAKEAAHLLLETGRFTSSLDENFDRNDLDGFLQKEKDYLLQEMKNMMLVPLIWSIYQQEEKPEKALSLAWELGNEFILSYLRLKIDLLNLKVISRGAYLALSEPQRESWLLPGGWLSGAQLNELQQRSFSEFGQVLEKTSYRDWWMRSYDFIKKEESFLALERESENLLIQKLREAKCYVFGPERVFAYAVARRHELKLFRLVVAGKLQQLPSEMIQTRISLTYVDG